MKTTTVLLTIAGSVLVMAAMPALSNAQECSKTLVCLTPPTTTGEQGGSLQGPDIAIGNPDPIVEIFGPDVTGFGDPNNFIFLPPNPVTPPSPVTPR